MIWLRLLVATHFFVVVGNGLAFFIIPFYQPWYVALPTCSIIFFLTFGRVECPSTRWENRIRRKLGMEEDQGFVKHYIVKTIKRILMRKSLNE